MAENDEKALDDILKQDEQDIARISESVFKARLLPILTQRGDDSNLQAWLEIAKSWRRPIQVLEDRTGELLFVIPALVGSNGQPVLQRADNSAYDLIENAQKKMRVVPRAGDEMLVKGLTNRIRIDGDRQEAIEAWNHIYRRYGYDDLIMDLGPGTESRTDTDAGPSSGPEFSGYDEA